MKYHTPAIFFYLYKSQIRKIGYYCHIGVGTPQFSFSIFDRAQTEG